MTNDRQKTEKTEKADKTDGSGRSDMVKAGVAVGVGSAAIVAALMYASRSKKKKG